MWNRGRTRYWATPEPAGIACVKQTYTDTIPQWGLDVNLGLVWGDQYRSMFVPGLEPDADHQLLGFRLQSFAGSGMTDTRFLIPWWSVLTITGIGPVLSMTSRIRHRKAKVRSLATPTAG